MPLEQQKTKAAEEKALTRTQRRQQRIRANLVSAVRKLTAEKGVDALTIRDIAEEADIAMGGFYNHFQSKDELLGEAVREIAFQSGEIIDGINAASDDPLEIVATAFTTFDGIIQDDPILGWFIVRMSAYDSAWAESLYDRFRRDVEEGIAQGKFSVPDVDLAIRSIGASLYTFYRARLNGRADDESGAHFIHMMLRLLGADESDASETARRVWNGQQRNDKENS